MHLPEQPEQPTDWRAASRAAEEALNAGQVATLSHLREIERAGIEWPASASMLILRNFTIEPLDRYVKLAAFRQGIELEVEVAGYDTAEFDVHDPSSPLREGGHDVVVLALWLDEIRETYDAGGRVDMAAVDAYLARLVSSALDVTASLLVINTLLPPVGAVGASDAGAIVDLNRRVHALAESNTRVLVTDLDRYSLDLGRDNAVDLRFLLSARAPVRPPLHRLWARDLAQVVASIRGRSRKVLAIDCDNTLWGGIIGEDGIEGITLSPNDRDGRLYYIIQSQLVALHRQGVLLTLCSRNNEDDVWTVLSDHPHCLIEKEMLAGWQINWNDKASNLEALARQMSLGLDAFVFLDDSAVECERIRRALPDVDVVEISSEPGPALDALAKYDGWSRLPITSDDIKRTARYRAEKARVAARHSAESLTDFLDSLNLVAILDIIESDASDNVIGRAAQLTQRTNQFNATSRRYGPGELAGLCGDPDAVVLRLRVEDRFGDYGTIGIAVVARRSDEVRLDTFLLSCRVLGRGIEDAFLKGVLRVAFETWPYADRVRIEYRQTAKNTVIRQFLAGAGLRLLSANGDSSGTIYVADATWASAAFPPHIQITMPRTVNRSPTSSAT